LDFDGSRRHESKRSLGVGVHSSGRPTRRKGRQKGPRKSNRWNCQNRHLFCLAAEGAQKRYSWEVHEIDSEGPTWRWSTEIECSTRRQRPIAHKRKAYGGKRLRNERTREAHFASSSREVAATGLRRRGLRRPRGLFRAAVERGERERKRGNLLESHLQHQVSRRRGGKKGGREKKTEVAECSLPSRTGGPARKSPELGTRQERPFPSSVICLKLEGRPRLGSRNHADHLSTSNPVTTLTGQGSEIVVGVFTKANRPRSNLCQAGPSEGGRLAGPRKTQEGKT